MFLEKLMKDVEVCVIEDFKKIPPHLISHLSVCINTFYLSTFYPLLSPSYINTPPVSSIAFTSAPVPPSISYHPQFLAQLKLMDYSLLVGIHDVEKAEQEDVESEDNEPEEDGESDEGGIGTPPDSPSNTLDSNKPLSPGEFDPAIDVYAIKSNDSE